MRCGDMERRERTQRDLLLQDDGGRVHDDDEAGVDEVTTVLVASEPLAFTRRGFFRLIPPFFDEQKVDAIRVSEKRKSVHKSPLLLFAASQQSMSTFCMRRSSLGHQRSKFYNLPSTIFNLQCLVRAAGPPTGLCHFGGQGIRLRRTSVRLNYSALRTATSLSIFNLHFTIYNVPWALLGSNQ